MFLKNYRLLKEEESHLDIQQRKTAFDHFLSIQSSVLSELIIKQDFRFVISGVLQKKKKCKMNEQN